MKRIKIFLTLIIMLSMCVVSAADEGTFEIDDSVGNVDLDLTVDYDAYVWVGTDHNTNYGEEWFGDIGDFTIEGTIGITDETYTADMTAKGWIRIEGNKKDNTEKEFTTNLFGAKLIDIDGRAYQNGETGYLYKDENNKYYGYIESGFNIKGDLFYKERLDQCSEYNLSYERYSKYVVTKSKPRGQFTLSAPSLGLGYKGSVAGDQIPELYTYRDTNTWKRVTTDTYPTGHDGPIIVTPARIAGEPLQETGYWDTAKGQRVSEWKANNN